MSGLLDQHNILPYPAAKPNTESWVLEPIWGHRLVDASSTAVCLEFLSMAEALCSQGELLSSDHDPSRDIPYAAVRCLELRNILFNNPSLEEINQKHLHDDERAWEEWNRRMGEDAKMGGGVPCDFAYLKRRFQDFQSFVDYVDLIRRIRQELESGRQWLTRFIYPIGPAAMYEALRLSSRSAIEKDWNVFGRSGEVAYLMLSRACPKLKASLRDKLEPLLSWDTARNKMLMKLISTETPDRGDNNGGAYLPYKSHAAYDKLAEDMNAVLSIGLPDQDVFQYFGPLLCFHLYLYSIHTSAQWGGYENPSLVCEILAAKSDVVRKASFASYTDNGHLGPSAVNAFIDRNVLTDPKVNELDQPGLVDEEEKLEVFKTVLMETCGLKEDKLSGVSRPEELVKQARTYLLKNYERRTGSALRAYAQNCGLLSRVGTNRYRYCPSDEFLQLLVLCNVTGEVEVSEFLRMLFDRYRIAIGPVEAEEAVSETIFDNSPFRKNQERLIARLRGLGLARRMSDSCTYISNPFARK